MIAAVPALGSRINIKAGSYSTGAVTLPTAGTIAQWFVLRGYNSTIGDLEANGRNADGTLNTTNFPVITLTGQITFAARNVFQCCSFTGALSNPLFASVSQDIVGVVQCALVNTQNNASAACLNWDNNIYLINCDFSCTGAAHTNVVNIDEEALVVGCRFKGVDTDTLVDVLSGTFVECCFIGTGSNKAVLLINIARQSSFIKCTFYRFATAVEIANSVPTLNPIIIDCHYTDCTKWIDNLYSGTSNVACLEFNGRSRDNTTPRTGVGDSFLCNEVTTDTGGAETDYVAAGSDNFRLISGAPGINGAMISGDIGAYQRVPDFPAVGNVHTDDTTDGATGTLTLPTVGQVQSGVTYGAGGTEFTGTLAAGGGLLTHPGMSGGMRG